MKLRVADRGITRRTLLGKQSVNWIDYRFDFERMANHRVGGMIKLYVREYMLEFKDYVR